MGSNDSGQTPAERLTKGWIALFITWTIGVSGTTWLVQDKVVVTFKENQIHALEKELADCKSGAATTSAPEVLHDVTLAEGESITTPDGVMNLTLNHVWGGLNWADLTATIGDGLPKDYKEVKVGQRVVAGPYFIDLHELRGNLVRFSVSKHNIQR